MEVLKSIGLALLKALLTEAFIKEVVVFLLKKLAKRSTNTVDDKLVEMVEKALRKQDESK